MHQEDLQFRIQSESGLAFGSVTSDRKYRLRLARYVGMVEAISSYLNEKSPVKDRSLKLLDVGSGRGRTLAFCETMGIDNQLDFYGFDNSTRRLQSILQPSRWNLKEGDAQAGLPYPSESFQICVCEQVLEHLHEPEQVIDEMVRVLQPDGLMIVGVPIFPPGIAHIRAWWVEHMDCFFGTDRSHVQTFTGQSIKKMVCSDHPLKLINYRGFRVISGGLISKLEDYRWWYDFNRWLGRTVPGLCIETQIVARKTDG